MGEVYRAKDLRLGREIAIKVLPAEVASSPDRLARFEREARTVAGLNHPNIVTLHTVEDADGLRFLTMELVEGQTLSSLVIPGGLPLPRLLELAIPLTDALIAAHEKGVIHRDLKPGNVMVTREGRVKVLDFGLAKMMGTDNAASVDATLTATAEISGAGRVVGTVPYMAPEQLRGESLDARADLFSLGVILYELAAGHPPFTGETSIDVSHAILRGTPEPLDRVRTDLPREFDQIVSQCLEKSPRERAQTALDVNNALRRLRKVLERGGPEKPGPEKVASIAVLPFVNRSASAEDEYFSDGLADELLHVLARMRGLRVTARTSSFHFKGKDTTIAEIGKALGVATILEGSVRKVGNRVRVSVQLVKVSDATHLWSETYDRTLEDIFAVQDNIAQSVVNELRTALLGEKPHSGSGGKAGGEVARAAKGRATDPEAHRLFLLARHLLDRLTGEETAKGIEYLKQALELDPEFALAWAELGRAYTQATTRSGTEEVGGSCRAREAVERALSLQPDLPEGHLRMGRIQMYIDWDWRGAEASYARALELAPEDARVLGGNVSIMAFCHGRFEEAIGLCRRAMELDPVGSGSHNALAGIFHLMGRFAEAEKLFRQELELHPDRGFTHGLLSETLVLQGRGEEALSEAMREPVEWARLYHVAIVHYTVGNRAVADDAFGRLLEKYPETTFQIAELHAGRGDKDAAFEWLERAYAKKDVGLVGLKVSPHLRSLHVDPRWPVFIAKMGF